jgi:hypothetical protein
MRNVPFLKVFPCLVAIVWLAGCGGGSYGGGGGGGTATLTVSPKQAAVVVTSQTQTFTATITGGTSTAIHWSVDGVAGGNATVGTITPAGIYTPPASAGTHTIVATSAADSTLTDSATIGVTDLSGVFTYHNNLARDGTNTHEFALAPATLNTAHFGKRFSCPVDGASYTQPLWVPALTIGGTVRNVIFVATQHDSVYAFDADTSPCMQLWQSHLLDIAHGGSLSEGPVPTADVGSGFQDIQPEIGVTGTPVIDPVSATIYVVSKSEGPSGTFHQRLHALDWTTGAEKFSGPVTIAATVPGTGAGSSGGSLSFNPQTEHERAALALSKGVVYVSWASHEDTDPYHGWIIAYNAATLARGSVFNSSANATPGRAGIWIAGGAPAFDSTGNLYVPTGNGDFDGNSTLPPNNDFGDSALKLDTTAGLAITDWFTPFNENFLNASDLDLGSGGIVLLPDQSSSPTHLMVVTGKWGLIYLLNRDSMGSFCNGCPSDTNTLQNFAVSMIWGTPAFWQNRLYYGGTGDHLNAFDFSTGLFNTTPSSQSSATFQFPGTTPSVSSQGTSGGVVWAVDSSQYGVPSSFGLGPAVLHAYDATNLGTELWNSSQAASNRDQAGQAVKFSVPTVANGKVYLGTRSEIEVYGLLP